MIRTYIELALALGPIPLWSAAVGILGLLGAINRIRNSQL